MGEKVHFTYHLTNTYTQYEILAPILATAVLASTIEKRSDSVSKTYNQCDLAKQLLGYGGSFTSSNINDWICLTFYESSWRTNQKGGPNYNGSYDYGIFQINDYYWCYSSDAPTYNDCNINCSSLLDDNIKDDSTCASMIYKRHGFDAWYGWKDNCKGKDLSSWTSGCNL